MTQQFMSKAVATLAVCTLLFNAGVLMGCQKQTSETPEVETSQQPTEKDMQMSAEPADYKPNDLVIETIDDTPPLEVEPLVPDVPVDSQMQQRAEVLE